MYPVRFEEVYCSEKVEFRRKEKLLVCIIGTCEMKCVGILSTMGKS